MKWNKKLILASSLFLVTTQIYADNLLTNGSFDTPVLTEPWKHLPIPPWTGAGELQQNTNTSGSHTDLPYPDARDNQILELASDKGYSISQTVSVTVGDKYILSFWAKFRDEKYNTLNVHLKGTGRDCGTKNDFTIKTTGAWTKYSYCICPTSKAFTLTFEQQEPTNKGFGLHLDDVRFGQP